MRLTPWLSTFGNLGFNRRPERRNKSRGVRHATISLEQLEDRALLSTFHVATNGDDVAAAADVTHATAFRSIQAAVNAAASASDGDDEIKVAAGIYNTAGVDALVITSGATASIPENTPASTVIIDVNTNDTPGHTVTYQLSGPDAALFAINSTTGEITFLASPDYEAPGDVGGDNVYNVTVAVTDNGVPTNAATQDLTITVTPVNDNGPVFVDASPSFSIPENSAVGTVVGGVTATDADSPAQSLAYSIISGNESGAFTIDPATGEITVADSTPLNFEVTPQFTLVVRVTDNGSPTPSTADATVVIDLTNVQEGAVLTIPNPQGTYHIGSVPAFISPDATFTYDDVSNPNYAGAQVTVSFVAGRGKRDKLSVFRKGDGNNEIDVKGRWIYLNGELIVKSKGGKGAARPDLVITLTGSATTAAVDNLVRRLNFEAKGDVGTTRTINVQVTNISGVDSNVATRDIDVVN